MWNIIGGAQKLTSFILKFYLYLPKENKECKPCHGTMESSFDLLSTCPLIMEFRFDAVLSSSLENENSNEGHIKCSRVPQVPHPYSIPASKRFSNNFFLEIV